VFIGKGRPDQQSQIIGIKSGISNYIILIIVIAVLALAVSACSAGVQLDAQTAAAAAAEIDIQSAEEVLEEQLQQETVPNKILGSEVLQSGQDQPQAQTGDPALPAATEQVVQPDATQPTAPAAVVESEQVESLPPVEPKVGFLAPDITLTTLDGSSVRLADLRGKNILINYWVTWCIPCMDELPILSRLNQDYQDQNVIILTVNGIEQDQLGEVQQLVAELGLTQPVLLDENESFWSTYLVQFLPTSFFIDTEGIIRHIMLGSATEDVIRSKIDQLIVNQL
jgi:cytochrome c biogenesis protein CcmG/thiol:disulfide interchange protein DsbE